MRSLNRGWIVLALCGLTACGGGGGNSGTSPFSSAASCSASSASAASGVASSCASLVAANLDLQLSSATVDNSGAASIIATATATTASGQALSGVPISFSVDNSAIFSVAGTGSGSDGKLSATVSPGSDPSNRLVTVTATSGSLSKSATFAVVGSQLTGTATPLNPVQPGSSGNRVIFRLVNANANPIVGQPITVTAASLPTATGVTDTAGEFTYTYTAPATTGPLDITAAVAGVSNTQTVTIATVSAVPNAVGPVVSASVSANPSVVATNSTATANRTEIRALFVGAGNAPIKNVRVRFDLAGDPTSIGGSFSAGDNTATGDNSVVYSDVNGVATTAYIPGTRASPTNGVTIRACYGLVDFTTCTTSTQTTITVASDPLAVTIGSNDVVYTGTADLTYIRKFVVLVVDSSGRAKGNVDIVPSVDIDRYYKGQYVKGATWFMGYEQSPITVPPTLVPTAPATCFNEDINRNGVNEVPEDINHSGSLEPRKSDVAISILGTGKTDSTGTATVQIEYPKNIATWARVKILVAATGISGTEGRAVWTEVLPAPVGVFSAPGAPAFVFSPYGSATFTGTVGNGIITYTNGEIDLFPSLFPDGSAAPAIGSTIAPCNNPY